MAKQNHATGASRAAGAGAAAAKAAEPTPVRPKLKNPNAPPGVAPGLEEIARLAYSYWQARGCPEGSPEEDWQRAEDELRKVAAAAGA